MSTSVFTNGTSHHLGIHGTGARHLSVPARGPALALAAELAPPALHEERDEQDDDERRAVQGAGDDVAELEQPEAAPPADGVGLVQPPRRDDRQERDADEPGDEREEHRLGPGPLEVPDERLKPPYQGLGSLGDRDPRGDLRQRGVDRDAAGLYRRASAALKHPPLDRADKARGRPFEPLVNAFTSID